MFCKYIFFTSVVKRMIRDYGKANDLVDVDDIADMLNEPERQPKPEAWASFRKAIVLKPINHSYEPVSAIPQIKKYSCFVPWAANRSMAKLLPCGRSCCMSLDAEKMLGCDNREVTGWFDDKKTGWYGVHYRINEPKKIVIKLRKEI